MSYRLRVLPLAALLATFTLAATTQASSPAGVWGRVDQVTFDPNAKDPAVRIDGVFIVANQKPDFMAYPGYSVPQYGYMLYNCPVMKELPMCLMQWNELLAVAGKDDNCRGWGNNANDKNGTVRPADAPDAKPDAYPIALGVTPGFSPCEAITTWQIDNPPPEEPAETSSSSSGEPGTTTNAAETTGGEEPGTTTHAETTAPGSTSGDPGSTSGGPGETGKLDDTGTPETSGDPVTSGPTEGGGNGSTTNATSATSDATATATATDGQSDDKGGCACNSDGPGDRSLTALALLGGLALLRRRRA